MTGSLDASLHTTPEDVAAQEITALWRDLAALAVYLRNVRGDLAAIGVSTIRESHLVPATDQLGAVVETTEVAAMQILDACDTLTSVARDVGGEPGQRILAALTTINEACGFQDLTGQRVVRVIQTLAQVEQKIARLAQVFGVEALASAADGRHCDSPSDAPEEQSLMNGPQLPAQAIDQAAIDRLLADFD